MRPAPGDFIASRRHARVDGRPREPAIDRFRGGLVVLMVIGDYIAGIGDVPAFLKHADDVGLTVADVVAPGFVFAMGLTYGASFARRASQGLAGAYRHFLLRYLSLIGIGAVISAGSTTVADQPSDWGVLQALGVAGLLCLPVIRLDTLARFTVGLLLLVGYQFLLDEWALDEVLASSHGGFIGSLSWGALLIMSTAMADLWRTDPRRFAMSIVAVAAVAAVAVFLVPISKNRVSFSYVLVSLASSALAWLIVDLGSRASGWRAGLLCWWGENALLLYLLHLMLLGLLTVPPERWWYVDASPLLGVLQLSAILTVTSLTAWWLHRRGLRVGL